MNVNPELIITQLGPLQDVAATIKAVNVSNGWFEGNERPFSADCALLHSEVSEMYEAARHRNPPSDHLPEFSAIEEEAADILIRLLDTATRHNLRLAEAVAAKIAFNERRGKHHGGKAE